MNTPQSPCHRISLLIPCNSPALIHPRALNGLHVLEFIAGHIRDENRGRLLPELSAPADCQGRKRREARKEKVSKHPCRQHQPFWGRTGLVCSSITGTKLVPKQLHEQALSRV